jgi:hypothetical protein
MGVMIDWDSSAVTQWVEGQLQSLHAAVELLRGEAIAAGQVRSSLFFHIFSFSSDAFISSSSSSCVSQRNSRILNQ